MAPDDASESSHDSAELGVWQLVGIGGTAVGCIVVGLTIGWLADSALDTSPALVLAGIATGIAAAVVGSWIRIRPFLQR